MLARTLGTLARYESEHRGERVAAAKLQRARSGQRSGGPRPFGYEDDGVSVREPEAQAVRDAVEAVLAGASLRSVVRDLNAAGLVTSVKGRRWDHIAVRAMLLRPRNAGLRQHQGQVIGPASWPAIVEEDQWRAAVKILTDPARRTSSSGGRVRWLGSGIYRCGRCERPSLRVSTAGHGIKVYRCDAQRETATGHVSRSAGPLDAYIEEIILDRLSRPDALELLRPTAPEVDLPALRATANTARARLSEIAEMLGEGELTRTEAQIARSKAMARLERAEAEITGATATSPLAGIVDTPDPAAVWVGLDIGRQRAVLDCLMTVTVLPSTRPGPGFDPTTIRIDPK
jgi:hypothetical protein